jgi:hypothetical protein
MNQQQPRSCRFHGLFDTALQNYEEMTHITLTKHPLAEKLNKCHSSKSITVFFRDRALEFGDFPGSDKVVKSITNIASILCSLSATATLGDDTDLVRSRRSRGHSISDTYSTVIPAGKSNTDWPRHPNCRACFTFFLCAYPSHIQIHQAAKEVNASHDELVALFESIEQLLRPLHIYAKIPPTPAMEEMVVKIMAELLSIFALMTKELKQGRSSVSLLVDISP